MDKYVIHTRNRTDREKLFTKELEIQNHLDFNIIEGVFDPIRSLTAISNAHKQAILCAQCNSSSSVLVVENDVKFTSPKSLDYFIHLVDQLPDDWDIFLGGISSGIISPVSSSIARVNKFTGFFCYIVRDRFYEKMLSADPTANIDYWIGAKTDVVAYSAQPMIAVTHSGFSDNVKRTVNYSKYFHMYKLWNQKSF